MRPVAKGRLHPVSTWGEEADREMGVQHPSLPAPTP